MANTAGETARSALPLEIEEYNSAMVVALLLNFPQVSESASEQLLVMRCDLESRFDQVDPLYHPVLSTMMLVGEGAVVSKAVSMPELVARRQAVVEVLNEEGLD